MGTRFDVLMIGMMSYAAKTCGIDLGGGLVDILVRFKPSC